MIGYADQNHEKYPCNGSKSEQLVYRKHSMYPSGLKETPYKDMMNKKKADKVRRFLSVSHLMLTSYITSCDRPYGMQYCEYIFPSFHVGKLGGNVLRSWDNGSLPPDYDPSKPTTSRTS
ncbi:hypothetical protein M378DRAFT_90368 [Amanita muscaria Koide BX008]|uniref:Uncharacterized protein n=1 Tax=Amanita muscaria (strain Koide BX008) TaxID=946122 RepID=A0A0C2WI08_AMAMK|nr:hypothetical protein M378DRAFT_90368 [Amanita muscaria Koide BX008]